MKPFFSVGEEVILQSVQHPELNGDYIVEKILDEHETTKCHVTGTIYRNHDAMYYILNGLSAPQLMSNGEVIELEISWEQRALRKKHKPSDNSFKEMISNLKRPQKLSQ